MTFGKVDFVVKHNYDEETDEQLTEKILYSLVIKKLKQKKPVIWFIGGDSGEGKSLAVIKLEQILLKIQGYKLEDYLHDINVYTPIEYAEKLDRLLLFNGSDEDKKRLRYINILAIHEARELIKAKNWYSFLNQAVSDVNALSRSVKRLCIFVVSQFIRDIDTTVRYTLNIYSTITRPSGRKSRLRINMVWKDDHDLEKPKLRKRRLSGIIIDQYGRRRRYIPEYLELSLPPKEIVQKFEKADREAKSVIIRRKLERLIKNMREELELYNAKVDAMVTFYVKNHESLLLIGKRTRGGKFKLFDDFKERHDLTPSEVTEFQNKLMIALKKINYFGGEVKTIEAEEDINEESDDETKNEGGINE